MSRTLVFLVSPDLYNSFDTLLIHFHVLLNKVAVSYFPNFVILKTGTPKNFCRKMSTNMLLSSSFWHLVGLVVLFLSTRFTFN